MGDARHDAAIHFEVMVVDPGFVFSVCRALPVKSQQVQASKLHMQQAQARRIYQGLSADSVRTQ